MKTSGLYVAVQWRQHGNGFCCIDVRKDNQQSNGMSATFAGSLHSDIGKIFSCSYNGSGVGNYSKTKSIERVQSFTFC